ncbi:MAG: J domain-containing protein [Acidimicrobiales bacterium]
MSRSHYEVLAVPESASRDQIHRAYLRLARHAHPDAGGSEAGMREINVAWTVLGDPATRRAYDRTIDRKRVFVGTEEGSVRPAGPADLGDLAGLNDLDDLDDRPIRRPSPRLPILAVVPVAIFAASVAFYALGVVLSARHLLGVAVVLFLMASLLMVALPFAQMTRTRRR